MQQYSLLDLQTFVAVVETGSFNQAADRLNTSTASASRRVSSLEKALGIRLLNRTTRRLSLTEAGQQFYSDVQSVLGGLQEAEETLRRGDAVVSGNLRMAAPMSFGLQRVAPLVPEFLARHPEIDLHLQLEDRRTDLYAEGIDLALRIGELRDSSLVATRLCDIELIYCAAPEYLAQHGEPASPAQLKNHYCLHYSLINFKDEWGISRESVRCPLSANNGEALLEAALQGTGLAAPPRFIAEKALRDKRLIPILDDYTPPSTSLYAVRLSRQFTPLKVRLLIEYLQEKLGKT